MYFLMFNNFVTLSLRAIDVLTPMFSDILIGYTCLLEFRFSFGVPGLICKIIEILPRCFGVEILHVINP